MSRTCRPLTSPSRPTTRSFSRVPTWWTGSCHGTQRPGSSPPAKPPTMEGDEDAVTTTNRAFDKSASRAPSGASPAALQQGGEKGMTRTSRHSFARLALVGLTAAALFSACGTASPSVNTVPASQATPASAAPSVAAHKAVAITVGVLRPGATQEGADALNLQISQFEAKYPWITVNPEEYNWTAPTFTAALAAGTLPDVFTIPFTDGKGLIAQHQIVNLDSRMRALPY